jgi:predicted aminopeptidase
MGYLMGQGKGQWDILHQARSNSEVLSDPNVSEEIKEKIRLIEKLKSFYQEKLGPASKGIYARTTFLDRDAVTYLVVIAPYDTVKPMEECFPFMGCFPYLGFFSEEKARKHASKQEDDGHQSFVRPVYAYSTLGHFDDTILSSFFHFDDYELVELVFHELFHTSFFIKNEVDLNENLANHFGRELAREYLKLGDDESKKRQNHLERDEKLTKAIAEGAKRLEQIYAAKRPLSREEAHALMDKFLVEDFKPSLLAVCREVDLKNCPSERDTWNNAALSAYATYEKSADEISSLRAHLNLDLPSFLEYLKKHYQQWQDDKKGLSFSDSLFSPVRSQGK